MGICKSCLLIIVLTQSLLCMNLAAGPGTSRELGMSPRLTPPPSIPGGIGDQNSGQNADKKEPQHCSDIPCSGCRENEYSAGVERLGVKRSTDHGATWTFLGHACFHSPDLIPVDPSAITVDGGVALYFFDLYSLRGSTHVVYRAITTNGLSFTPPQAAYSTSNFVTDPFVLRLFNGTYLMYMHDSAGIRVAASEDGATFPGEGVVLPGSLPGALQLPTGEVRLFECGTGGIISSKSPDGMSSFVQDPGLRIAAAPGTFVCDPNPIALRGGGYLMAYKVVPRGGQTPQDDEVYLATSENTLDWISGRKAVALGSVPSIVELADGTLLLYYVDFNYK